MEVVVNDRFGRFTPEKEIWYPWYRRLKGPVTMGAENLVSSGIRYPSRPARSELKFYNTDGMFCIRFVRKQNTAKLPVCSI